MAKKKHDTRPAVCTNRKAGFRFELLERLECGLVLHGAEVKSLRDGQVTIEDAYARIENDELWVIGLHIGPYSHDALRPRDPARRRKLLIHARELRKLRAQVDQKALTLVPVRVYFNDRGIAKIEIAVARGKKTHDKRESIKTREHQREMSRAMAPKR